MPDGLTHNQYFRQVYERINSIKSADATTRHLRRPAFIRMPTRWRWTESIISWFRRTCTIYRHQKHLCGIFARPYFFEV